MTRILSVCLSAALIAAPVASAAGPSRGDAAPGFELAKPGGGTVTLEGLGASGLLVVSFLALDSKPSRELAVTLSGLRRDRDPREIAIVGIAREPADDLRSFEKNLSLGFSLLHDPDGTVMERWGAAQVVPITYLLAPGGMVAEVVRGGGMTSQQLLLSVAEKEFARGNYAVAETLFGEVAREDPKNAGARAGKAFALAKAGKLERAEEEFAEIGALGEDGSRLSAEGLAEVALLRGDLDRARKEAGRAGPKSVQAEVVRGEIAAREGKLGEARASFARAADAPAGTGWQRAIALNNLARVVSSGKSPAEAVEGHDRAIAAEPFLVEARSDKGAALAKADRPAEAKKALATARTMAPADELVATLLRRLEERERESADLERQKLVDKLVGELAESFRTGKVANRPDEEWSPRRVVVSFVDLRDELGPLSRAGIADAFVARATERLRASGRLDVVERETLDRLLAELKLGSSELADPATRLRLGRVLAAAAIATGSFSSVGGQDRLELRLIDTETTEIRATASEAIADPARIGTVADAVADRILATMRAAHPLRGKIAEVEGGEILVGIGKKHGLAVGTELDVVELGKPVEVDGQVVGHRRKKVGRLRVVAVEDGFATAEAVEGDAFAAGQLLVEVAGK